MFGGIVFLVRFWIIWGLCSGSNGISRKLAFKFLFIIEKKISSARLNDNAFIVNNNQAISFKVDYFVLKPMY
jgi:hypothetical protein